VPGLGYDVVWDYIQDNTLSPERQPALAAR
jgi:hypothetical protein